MFDTDEIYERLTKGDIPEQEVAYRRHSKRLVARARNAAESDEKGDRLGGLRVASALGGEKGLSIISEYLNDSDLEVRRYAFNQVVASRMDGVPLLRRFVEDDDKEISTEAMRLIALVRDKQAVSLGRRLLRHDNPNIRGPAATLLGDVAGKAVLVDLRRLLEDPVKSVQEAAAGAIGKLNGEAERSSPEQWWDQESSEYQLPMPAMDAKAKPSINKPKSTGPMVEEEPEPVPEKKPVDPKWTLSGRDKKELPVPVEKPPEQPQVEVPPEAWRTKFAPLPKTMPTEPQALLKLLGMVAQADRGPVLMAMAKDLQGIGQIVLSWRPGKEPTLGRGCAVATAELQRAVWIGAVSRWSSAEGAGVRAAVAEAIGALGKAATIPALNALVADVDPGVRIQAARSWIDLGKRLGREHMARSALHKLTSDKDEAVKSEAKELLETL